MAALFDNQVPEVQKQVLVEIPVACSWDGEVVAAHFTPARKTDHYFPRHMKLVVVLIPCNVFDN